jgi:hypothetical protein
MESHAASKKSKTLQKKIITRVIINEKNCYNG